MMRRWRHGAFVLALLLAGCGPSQDERDDMRKRAVELAIQDAADELSARTYESTFGEKLCAPHCDRLAAGFRWAAENDVTDPLGCETPPTELLAGGRASGGG